MVILVLSLIIPRIMLNARCNWCHTQPCEDKQREIKMWGRVEFTRRGTTMS